MKKILYLSAIFLVSLQLFAQPKSQWRGDNRDGIYPDINLLDKWAENGPELLWHFDELGQGYSSAAVTNDVVLITGMIGDKGYVFALDHTGKLKWKTEYGTEWTVSFAGTRTTPLVDNDKLYLISSFGLVLCMNVSDGKIVWKKDVLTELGGVNIKWGITENLLVEDNKVICSPGGSDANVVALDKNTGEVIWKCAAKGDESAYCSPQIVRLPNRKLVVTHSASSILGIDFETGKLLWSHSHPNKWSVHANTPIYHHGQLFCFSGYGKGSVMLQLSEDGSSVTELWSNTKMDSRMGGAILLNGKIYGSGDVDKSWQCVDWKTGNLLYSSTEVGNGTVSYADGKLYCYSEKGELAMLIPEESGFKVADKINIKMGSMQHWAHLVIHNGVLYLRHGNSLMAYKVSK